MESGGFWGEMWYPPSRMPRFPLEIAGPNKRPILRDHGGFNNPLITPAYFFWRETWHEGGWDRSESHVFHQWSCLTPKQWSCLTPMIFVPTKNWWFGNDFHPEPWWSEDVNHRNLKTTTRWWFQTFSIFTPTWGNDSIWLLVFPNGLKNIRMTVCDIYFRATKTHMRWCGPVTKDNMTWGVKWGHMGTSKKKRVPNSEEFGGRWMMMKF